MPISVLIPLFALFWGGALRASTDLTFGVDAQTMGRVGSVLAEESTPFAAGQNPAVLANADRTRFGFGTAQVAAQWAPFQSVVTRVTQAAGDRIALREDYQVPADQTMVWSFGFVHPFRLPFLPSRRIGMGVTASGPFETLRRFNAGAPYDFQPLRYGVNDTQFKGALGASLEVIPEVLSAGLGVTLYMTGAGDAEATLIANDPTARIALDVALNSAAVAAIFLRAGEHRLGVVYRQALDPSFSQQFKGKVQVGDTVIAQQPIAIETSLYYEPASVELDWQHFFSFATVSAGAAYQRWQEYRPSYLMLQATDSRGTIRQTKAPPLSMHDTVSPRVSLERAWPSNGSPASHWVTSLGYRYRPTPLGDASSESNLFDTDVHVVGASLRYRPDWEFLQPWRVAIGLFAQWHRFSPRDVAKSDPMTRGGPGYRIDGSAYSYGLSAQVDL